MAHRSNQAVASQDRPLTQPDLTPPKPPRRRRALRTVGWLALAALILAVLASGIWLLRAPLAELAVRQALADRGLAAQFRVAQLELGHVVITEFTAGDPVQPDLAAAAAIVNWRWRGLNAELTGLRLVEPRVRLSVDENGRVSAGTLDRLRSTPAAGGRPRLPRIALVMENGVATIAAPFGELRANFQSTGAIGSDFSAHARIEPTTQSANGYAIAGAQGELTLQSVDERMTGRLALAAQSLRWNGMNLGPARLNAAAETALDLSRVVTEASWRVASMDGVSVDASTVVGAAGGVGNLSDAGLALAAWRGEARLSAARVAFEGAAVSGAQLSAQLEGASGRTQGGWTLNATRFDGWNVHSARPSVAGRVLLDGGAFSGDALLNLGASALSADAQEEIRRALPNAGETPIGPTMAQAEAAFDAAADRFDLAIPLRFNSNNEGARLSVVDAIEVRAATGGVIRALPLRNDTPTLVVQWPGRALHGAAAIEMAGGGMPAANFLLDAIDWAPSAPFEAEGTVTISNWRTDGAEIAADDLALSLSTINNTGLLDLRGPMRIAGPLGDGRVEDMVADLNVAVTWAQGWRVAPSDCLPVRLARLQAVGLAFQGGAFRLCPAASGALISANANGQVSDGFRIEALSLNGHMAGEDGQPARLSSSRIVGRFGGTMQRTELAIEAAAPTLAVDMGAERTLTVTGSRLTADAAFGGEAAWAIEGAFEQGSFDDPAMPGEVTAISGRWSAAPEDGRAVVRVAAGEALVTAHPASAEDERPLFNTMRFAEVSAELRDGDIGAQGALLLDAEARNLAHFTAEHDIASGVGVAHFNTEQIVFGEDLQPFQITEFARGVVENVRGPATIAADVTWNRETLTASGRVRLDGVSLAMSTIPVIDDVRGEVFFDDLFKLTTPPGQAVTVGLVNPGIAVRNGRVRFQLLGDLRVKVEQAEFDFASGVLALEPTEITLGADEARVRLLLRSVDAAALLAQLNLPDLTASGQIEGSFPLHLTRRTAFVEDGVLSAAPGGGVIQYTGTAGENATGAARVAFEALRSFSYDDLRITLNGDISGEVVSSISFTGRNTGRAVDISELAPIPGVGRVTARGVPFAFNVTVTAPFRRLAETAAGFTNPGEIVGDAINRERDTQNPLPDE